MAATVAASILSADLAHLADQVRLVEAHARSIHVDCMDAHFVPPLSIGPVVVESLRPITSLPLHCHLMVADPVRLLPDFAAAGADAVTAHVEAVADPAPFVARATDLSLRPGLAVSPDTPVDAVFPHLDRLDRVLVMSVRPGWAGQPFIEASLPKIEAVRNEVERRGLAVDVEVDGGVDEETGRRCVAAGATILAAASSIFKASDPREAARRLEQAAVSVAATRRTD